MRDLGEEEQEGVRLFDNPICRPFQAFRPGTV